MPDWGQACSVPGTVTRTWVCSWKQTHSRSRIVQNVTCACRRHPCKLESLAIYLVGTSPTEAWAEGLTLTLGCPDSIHPTTRKGPPAPCPRAWAGATCKLQSTRFCHSSLQSSASTPGGAVLLLVTCLPCKPEDLSSALSTYVKRVGHGSTFLVPDLKR